jgi:hypothetical protein
MPGHVRRGVRKRHDSAPLAHHCQRLADLRLVVSRAYSYRRQTGRERMLVSSEMRQILATTGLSLEANIIAILEKSIKKSKRLVVKGLEDERVVVIDGQKRYLVDATG